MLLAVGCWVVIAGWRAARRAASGGWRSIGGLPFGGWALPPSPVFLRKCGAHLFGTGRLFLEPPTSPSFSWFFGEANGSIGLRVIRSSRARFTPSKGVLAPTRRSTPCKSMYLTSMLSSRMSGSTASAPYSTACGGGKGRDRRAAGTSGHAATLVAPCPDPVHCHGHQTLSRQDRSLTADTRSATERMPSSGIRPLDTLASSLRPASGRG